MKLRCRIPLASFELNIDVAFDTHVTAIFGPSGSGKTTLLDAIAGLRDIADGEIEIDGRVLFSSASRINLPPQQRGVGYVPQEGALFPHLSVRKNILFGAERKIEHGRIPRHRTGSCIRRSGNPHLLTRPITKLSGGEAQRVALARAILSSRNCCCSTSLWQPLISGSKKRSCPIYAGFVTNSRSR